MLNRFIAQGFGMPTEMKRELVHDHPSSVECKWAEFADSASTPDLVVFNAGLAHMSYDQLGRENDAWIAFCSINSHSPKISRRESFHLPHILRREFRCRVAVLVASNQ